MEERVSQKTLFCQQVLSDKNEKTLNFFMKNNQSPAAEIANSTQALNLTVFK